MVVDLKTPAGVALLRRMIPTYDVVLEGFRPGVLARLGCSHDDMLALNPRLVVCAITGYGQTGATPTPAERERQARRPRTGPRLSHASSCIGAWCARDNALER